ncbi:uncharacterized protein J3R85_008170, partial [Psidium guajava]
RHGLRKQDKSYGQDKGYNVMDICFWWILSKCMLTYMNKSMIVKVNRIKYCLQTTFFM